MTVVKVQIAGAIAERNRIEMDILEHWYNALELQPLLDRWHRLNITIDEMMGRL